LTINSLETKNNILKNRKEMKLYTHEEMLNKTIGEHGTAERANYDARMNAFLMNENIKKVRESKKIQQ